MTEPEPRQSKPSPPDTQSWYEYIWRAEQETPNRLEDAAKFLATMISISLTLFLAIGQSSFQNIRGSAPLMAAVVLWLLSLLFAFWVLFPHRYRYAGRSLQSIKDMQRRVVRRKYRLLLASLALFGLALVILALVFFT